MQECWGEAARERLVDLRTGPFDHRCGRRVLASTDPNGELPSLPSQAWQACSPSVRRPVIVVQRRMLG